MRKLALWFLAIYQKFFTLLGYGSCRYYPTCSEYAKWQFEKNSLIKATFFTFKRVLTCNQLFIGGIDYPIIKCNENKNKLQKISIKKIKVKYWYVKKENNNYFLLKSFEN